MLQQRQLWTFTVLLALFGLLSACGTEEANNYTPEYQTDPIQKIEEFIFGVHPLHNPKRLYEVFGPITDYLTQEIPGVVFKLEASRNYASFDEKLYAGKFHFALPNPYQTVNSLKHSYHVFGKMSDDENFRGIILVRKDGNINKISDLKGKAVSFPAPTALAATMMPQYYMQTHGLQVMEDIEIRYVGSQESSIMNVFLGDVAAAATWPPPWRALCKERPELAENLKVKWSTSPLPNNGLVVRDDVPHEIAARVSEVFFTLQNHEEGRAWLERMELSQFEPATNETYAPVFDFLEKFNEAVRPIDY